MAPYSLLVSLKGHFPLVLGQTDCPGKLLGQDTFWVTEPEAGGLFPSRGRERRVFLRANCHLQRGPGRRSTRWERSLVMYKNSIKVGRGPPRRV